MDIWLQRAKKAEIEANRILADSGFAVPRIIFLEDVKDKLIAAPIDVREYFDEAIVCLKNDLTRSAIVVAWAGFFSIFCEKFVENYESEIRKQYSSWKFVDSNDLKETTPDSQLITASRKLEMIGKPKVRMLDGWLAQRNQCAHPTVYKPTLNVAIGYVDSMISETLDIL